jgi:hypothetical protein
LSVHEQVPTRIRPSVTADPSEPGVPQGRERLEIVE